MKPILAVLLLVFMGCAHTTIYEGGKKVFRTQADAENVTYRSAAGSYFHADKLNHSNPTLAQGKAAKDKLDGVTGLIIGAGGSAIFK